MAITYNAGTNTITVTAYTEAVPCNFTDIYNADKAGTLSLHARTGITGTDGAGVAVDRAERPADYVVLGGVSNDLYITIANWNGTTSTIRITGTDRDGAAQTEDIVVNANGTYYTTKWFKTITTTQVTTAVVTTFDYDLIQGQWGVIWNQGTNQYAFDASLKIGDGSTTTWFGDIGKVVTFKAYTIDIVGPYYSAIYVVDNANIRLGNIHDATDKIGKDGCVLFFYTSSYYAAYPLVMGGSANGYFYDSVIYAQYIKYHFGSRNVNHTGQFTVWTSKIDARVEVSTSNNDLNKVDILNHITQNTYCITAKAPISMSDIKMFGAAVVGAIYCVGTTITIRNLYARDNDYIARYYFTGYIHLIDADTDTWSVIYSGSGNSITYREYSFNLKVIDKDNVAISSASVKVWDKNNNLVIDKTTDVNGEITETILINATKTYPSNTFVLQTPHLIKITKEGYTNYEADFTLEDKANWTIALQGVLKRNPPMTGGMV